MQTINLWNINSGNIDTTSSTTTITTLPEYSPDFSTSSTNSDSENNNQIINQENNQKDENETSNETITFTDSGRGQKNNQSRRDYETIKRIEQFFWPWEQVLKFCNLRSKYAKDQRHLRIFELPLELAFYICKTRAKLSTYIPDRSPDQKFILDKKGRKIKNQEGQYTLEFMMKTSEPPIAVGHYGIVFNYNDIHSNISGVLKLSRWEHIQRGVDCYSFLMEMIILLIIQNQSFLFVPRILDIVRTPKGDLGYVMERLEITLDDFFMIGVGSKNYIFGLLILLELSQILVDLQNQFDFRHRDLRMKNIMLTTSIPRNNCVKIIDLGHSSIQYQHKLFSAYPGSHYNHVTSDFDLGFFFADMLIRFERENKKCRYQLEKYEPFLLHFIEGIPHENLIHAENHLSKLWNLVDIRSPETKKFSTPEYVCQYLYDSCEKLQ